MNTSPQPASQAAIVRQPSTLPDHHCLLHTVVRGHAFAARPPDAPTPMVGARVQLVREGTNPIDAWAVAVWHDDGRFLWRLGYLDRAVAARVGPRLDHGMRLEAHFVGWVDEPDGRWQRPEIAISWPATPSATIKPQRGPSGNERLYSAVSRRDDDLAAEQPVRLWGRPPASRRKVQGSGISR